MPSPFPGMDPYLEGYLWPDVHSALANKIRQQLTPCLRPLYVARLEISVVKDETPEAEIGIMYPDVEIIRSSRPGTLTRAPVVRSGASVAEAAVAPLTIPVLEPVEVRLTSVEIRDVAQNQLVTVIEILSPVNKREPGLARYRQKRQRLHRAGVHLLEIDLLRRGSRPVVHPRLPEVAYLLTLTRAGHAFTEVWPINLLDSLPVLPVPLRSPDPDTTLDLPTALSAIYDEAAYDLSIDYTQPPPPPELSEDMINWVHKVVSGR